MQEEVEQRVFTLIVNCTKLTEQELRKALSKFLAQMKTRHQTKQPHGKMTVKKLAAQNRGLQSVEVTDQNIGSFNRIARKYGMVNIIVPLSPVLGRSKPRVLTTVRGASALVLPLSSVMLTFLPLTVAEAFSSLCSRCFWGMFFRSASL